MSKISPEAARRPLYGSPYQLAMPVSVAPMVAGTVLATGDGEFIFARCAQPEVALIATLTRAVSKAICAEPA